MPAPAGPLTAPPVRLLTLEYAGRTWRVSTRPVEIPDGSRAYLYRGGLAPFDVRISAPLTGVASAQSMAVELIPHGDLAELAAQGHLLDEMTAEVALYRDGDEWAERYVVLQGTAKVESGGYQGRALRLQVLGDDPSVKAGLWPPDSYKICAETWTSIAPTRTYDPQWEGQPYQTVLGRPGLIWTGGAWAEVPAVPAYGVTISHNTALILHSPWGRVDTWAPWAGGSETGNHLLLGHGYLYPGSGARKGRVTCWRDNGNFPPGSDANFFLYYAWDALGQVVTTARLIGATINYAFGDRNFASYPNLGGGLHNEDYSGPLTGAGEIVRYALARTTRRIDWRRTGPRLDSLDRFRLAGYWDEPVDPWVWCRDNVYPLLPCSWIPGPAGLYPVVWRWWATARQADWAAVDGLNCTIQGEPKHEGIDEVRSAHLLDYANAIYGGTWRRRASWHGRRNRDMVRESSSIHLQRASMRWAGADELEEAESSDLIYDDATADRVLAWRSMAYSRPREIVRIVGDGLHHRSGLAHLEPGMVVSLTSSRYSYSGRVAHVREAGWIGPLAYADLVIFAQP